MKQIVSRPDVRGLIPRQSEQQTGVISVGASVVVLECAAGVAEHVGQTGTLRNGECKLPVKLDSDGSQCAAGRVAAL